MRLEGKLERWHREGLIDADTARRIAAFEDGQRRPIALYALGALGAGTVALGIVSIVAANWDAIPGRVKLAVDLLAGLCLALGTRSAVRANKTLATEVLVTLFYGFTLASLGLVGQVYQLDTPTYQALLVWTLATLPLLLLARSRYVAGAGVIGLLTTHALGFEALFEHLERIFRASDRTASNTVATLLYVSPPLYVALGRLPWLVRQRAEHAYALASAGWLGLALGGFGSCFVWYERQTGAAWLTWSLPVAAAVSAGLVAGVPRLYPTLGARARSGLAFALGTAFASLALGTTLGRDELPVIGALFQLAFLAALAWTSVRVGQLRVFNALTAAIALRILAVYFEVFHSLLSTGLGLITGGILTLLLAWLWRRKAPNLAESLRPPNQGGADG